MRNEQPRARPTNPRKRSGQSLIEVLVAFCVLALIIPSSIDAISLVFAAELRVCERERKISCAEWWFNRLESPVSQTQIDTAPRANESGTMRFGWEVEFCEYNAFRITLRVSNGTGLDTPFIMTRVY
ncbi:MAG: hypothetical protein LBJ36_12070 [Synergistaceae bacterium]|jgi:Tfp pilus assembly protein PilV|nr:hypothetical protein [Synergistaceae bacterium]